MDALAGQAGRRGMAAQNPANRHNAHNSHKSARVIFSGSKGYPLAVFSVIRYEGQATQSKLQKYKKLRHLNKLVACIHLMGLLSSESLVVHSTYISLY